MCQAKRYINSGRSTHLDGASPIDASPELLSMLPPLLLIVGSAEVLLGENIAFAQRAQAAGAPVVAEVFTHMWHDFMQETEGCGAGHPMAEAVNAVQRLGHFLKNNETCRVVCENGKCGGYGAVKWHFRYNELPTPTPKDC